MRLLFALVLGVIAAVPQPISAGVKAGVPLTDLLDARPGAFFVNGSVTNRYLIGPTVEARLPFGLGVEVDAIYRHFRYTSSGGRVNVFGSSAATGNDWEFPLLAKYRFHKPPGRPYVDTGIAWDVVSGHSQNISTVFPVTAPGPPTTTTFSSGLGASHNLVSGFVIGGGLEMHAGFVQVSPEVRYTRWFSQHFTSTDFEFGILASQQNQAEFLLGLTFSGAARRQHR